MDESKQTIKKEWVTPELKIITEFDVHENIATTYQKPIELDLPPNNG